MWVFLSRRLRRWLLLVVALPVIHKLVHKGAGNAQYRNPASPQARVLGKADSMLTGMSQQAARRRPGYQR